MSEPDAPPATRDELATRLDALGIRADCYDLHGDRPEDSFVMDHRPEGWVVFYSERGGEVPLARYDREADACADLFARVTAGVENFLQLVVGPAPVATADEEWASWLSSRGIQVGDLDDGDWKTDDIPWVLGPYWRRYFVKTTVVRSLEAR